MISLNCYFTWGTFINYVTQIFIPFGRLIAAKCLSLLKMKEPQNCQKFQTFPIDVRWTYFVNNTIDMIQKLLKND